MNFISAYSKERRSKANTPAGDHLEKTYGYEVDKKGLKMLVENGVKNVYEKIQEYLEETKIENVIQRVIQGDETVLRPNGIYEDITKYPNTLMDAMNQIHALENTYDSLSKELKEKYPTIQDFVEKSGTATWMEDLGYIQRVNQETLKENTITEKGDSNES